MIEGERESECGQRREGREGERGRGEGGAPLGLSHWLVPSVTGIIDHLTPETLSTYPDTFHSGVLDFFPSVAHSKEFTEEDLTSSYFNCQARKYLLTLFHLFIFPSQVSLELLKKEAGGLVVWWLFFTYTGKAIFISQIQSHIKYLKMTFIN